MSKKRNTGKGERIARFLCFSGSPDHKVLSRRIDRAIAAAVRKERERCAKIAESFGGETFIGKNIAAKIRSGQ